MAECACDALAARHVLPARPVEVDSHRTARLADQRAESILVERKSAVEPHDQVARHLREAVGLDDAVLARNLDAPAPGVVIPFRGAKSTGQEQQYDTMTHRPDPRIGRTR
jgi:hypothetical protein